jgi:predicted ester cyclase
MNKREIVQALMDAVQKGDFEDVRSMLSDDFRFSGPIPNPINAEAWLEMSASMKAAFPDLNYHFKVIGTNGDVVKTTTQLSGTHNGTFDLTGMDMGLIPATHKAFSAALQKTRITVRDDKISLWAVEPTAGGDLTAVLDQLGVKPISM